MNRRSPRATLVLVVLGLAGGLALAACSNGPNVSTTTNTSASTTTSSTSSTSSSSTSTTSASTCSTGVLQLTESAGGASAGTSYFTFSLINGGPSTCSLDGFPNMEFFAASGAGGAGAGMKLPIAVQDSTQSATSVVLKHGASAEFLLFVHEVPSNGVGCATVASVEVFPPGGSEALSIPVMLNVCGGSVTVDPIGPAGSENP
jgi:hypothetical protein